jgi:hypothetical protein
MANQNETAPTAQPDLHFERELWETAVTLQLPAAEAVFWEVEVEAAVHPGP